MTLIRMAVAVATVFLATLHAACGDAAARPSAANYPTQPITIVVPFGAGTGADLVVRIVGQQLSQAFNQPVIVENKPGANGAIGATRVAHSAPDGYMILLGTSTSMSAARGLNGTIAYDPVKDFTPVCRLGSFTQMLLVHPSLPITSISELIAYAKAHPGQLSFASGNASAVVAGETLKRRAGIDILHVPYKTSGPAIQDVLAGRVSMVFTEAATGLPYYRTGALRGLATTRGQRSALVPELPTLDESGITGFDMDSWAAFFLPANTPGDIVARLNGELRKIIDAPDVRKQIATQTGFEAFSSSVEELDAFNRAQLVKWTQMIEDAGIAPE